MTTQQNVPKISFLKKGSSALDFVRLQEIGCGMYHINIVNLFCVKIYFKKQGVLRNEFQDRH